MLQRKDQNGEWKNHHTFSIDPAGVHLSQKPYTFEFSETLEDVGEHHYRLVADYVINRSEDEQQQKGSLELGAVTVVEEESVPTVESSTSTAETEVSTDKKGSSLEESTINSDSEEDSQKDESAPMVESPKEATKELTTLINNQRIPEMPNNYMDAFQRGLGIMPMASAILTPAESNFYKGQTASHNEINRPIVSAKYTSKTKVELTLKLVWKYRSYGVNNLPLSVAEATTGIDSRGYGFYFNFGGTRWGNVGSRTIKGNVTASHLSRLSGTEAEGKLKSFSNQRSVRVVESGSGFVTRDAWSDNTTTIVISDIPVNNTFRFRYELDYNYSANVYIDYTFAAPNVVDLTNVSTPNFEATDEQPNFVHMLQGTYSGDISDSLNDGKLQLSLNNGASWTDHITNLEHSKSKGGTYGSSLKTYVSGLTAGTEYYARVILKDWLSNEVRSGNRVFYTPNSVEQPSSCSLGTPTTPENASAKITASYNVGVKPAHPTIVETQMWDPYVGKWLNMSTSPVINTSTKTFSYELKNLKTNTLYSTKYRVKNASNKWSPWSVYYPFTTRSVPLKVLAPTFNKTNTTTTSITMNSGTYTGHVSDDSSDLNKGWIKFSNTLTESWTDWTYNLGHDTTCNGNYNGLTFNGLQTGTTYKFIVSLKNAGRTYIPSEVGTFYTLNSVNKPVIDTIHPASDKYSASATMSGIYDIGPVGTDPAHPDKVKVQIKQDGAPNWTDVTSISTPSLDNQSIDESSTKGIFKINKLKASTKYHVRYQVENKGGWSEWSVSEEFTTLGAPPALEIIDAPQLDFGLLEIKNYAQTANLSAASQKNHLIIDNTDTTKRWKLTASLEQLKRRDDPSIVMPWAILSMKINLQDSSDDGATWGNNSNGGAPRTISFNSGDPAQDMWEIANSTDAQGLFRTEIDWNSVKLRVPENQVGHYKGNLVWSLDDTL